MNDHQPEHLKKPKDRVNGGNKRKPKKKVATDKERDIQSLANQYCRARGAVFIRIPDSAFKAIHNGNSLSLRDKGQMSQHLKGLPDMTIFHPTRKFLKKYPVVLPLEIKTEIGKMSQAQMNWQQEINTVVVYGWDETKKAIDDFLDS